MKEEIKKRIDDIMDKLSKNGYIVERTFDDGRNIDIENSGYWVKMWDEVDISKSLVIRVKSKIYRVFFYDDEAYCCIDCETFDEIISILDEHNAKNYKNTKGLLIKKA